MAGLTWLDAAVVAWVLVSALIGLRRGLVLQTLSLVGFAIGAIVGSRLAPHLLENGERSPWLPVASLLGAVTLGTLAQAFAGLAALPLRKRVVAAGLGPVDAAGGLLAGTAFGLALAWLIAVVAVQSPGLDARDPVRRSTILPALIEAVPPRGVLRALARFDPLPVLPGIATDLDPPDPRVVIPLRGSVRHGHSGGPVLDRNGRVVATMFAAQRQGAGGFGVANDAVREALRAPHDRAVDPGRCAG
jgi:uncharacterized membrane protein required for colicin V production